MALAYDPAYAIDDDEEAPVAPAPAPVAEPAAEPTTEPVPEREPVLEEPGADKLEPVTPKPATRPTGPMVYDPSLTFDPAHLPDPPPEAEAKDEGGGGFWAQLANASTQAVASTGVTAQMFNDLAGGDQNNAAGQIGKWIEEAATLGPGYQPKIEDFTKIGSFSDASLYVRESLGAGVGSMVAPFLAFITGSAAGTPVLGVTAALATTFSQNAAESYKALHADPEIQKALAEGKISRQQIAAVATGTGGVMASLDAVGLNKLAKITGIGGELLGKAAKEVARKTLVRRVLEGGATEGATEMAQNIVQEATRMASGGEKDLDEAAIRSINALFTGAIPGAAISAKGKSSGKPAGQTGNEGDGTVTDDQTKPETAPGAGGPGTAQGAPPAQPAGGGDTGGEDETKPEVKQHIGTSTPMQERVTELRKQNPGWTLGRAFAEAQRERTEAERPPVAPGVDPDLGAAAEATTGAAPNEFASRAEAPGQPIAGMTAEQTEADELGMSVEQYRETIARAGAAPAAEPVIPSPAPGRSAPATPSTSQGVSDAAAKPVPEITPEVRREQSATSTAAQPAGLDEAAALAPTEVSTQTPASPLTPPPAPAAAPTPPPSPAPGEVEAPAAQPITEQPGAPPVEQPGSLVQETTTPAQQQAWDNFVEEQRQAEASVEPAPAPMVQEPALAEAVSPATEAGVPVTPPAPARETFAPQPSPREPAPTPERVTPKVAALVTKAREEPVTRRVTEEPPVAARAGPKGRAVLGLKTKVEAPTTIKEKAKPIPEKLKEKIEAAPRKTEQKKEEIPETKAEREERLERERAETREKLADQAAKEHVEALEKKAAADKAKREGETGTAQEKEKITPKKAATGEISSASLKNRKREDVERTAVRIGEKLGENAPEPVKRILALKEARKPFAHGGGKNKARQAARERIHAQVDAEIDKWIAELEAAEAAREPSPQEKAAAREKELAETKTVLERQLTESETEEITARNRKAQQEEAYKAENDAAKAAVDQHFVPKMAEAAKTWDLATLREGVRAARAAFKGEVPAELGRDQGPWVNFLVYAGRKTSKAVEIVSAYTWVAKGQTDEFYSYAMDDPTVARVGVSGFEQEADDTLDLTGKKIDDSAMVAPADIESWLEASEEPGKGQVLTVKRRDGTTYTHTLRERQSHTAASLLKSIGVPASFMESPLVRAIDKRVRQELTRLVGNTPVYVVPDHVIDDIREAGDGSHALGLFIAPTVAQRAQGYRGAILVVEGATRNHAQYAHVLKHEMTHAAVDFAYDTNFKNSKEIFDTLFLEASTMGLMTGVLKKGEYGLTSPKEFMAEAISNPRFQEKLSRLSASPGLATALKSMPMRGGLLSSMWQKFVAQVSRIIGANIYGNAGMSYTEATLTLFGATAQEKAEMMAWAERQRGTAGFTSARTDVFIDGMRAGVPDGKVPDYDEVVDQIFDAPLLSSTAAGHVQTVKEWFDTKGGQSSLRQNRYRYTAFTKDLRNLVTDMLGDTAKPLVDAMNAHLGRDALRSRLSEAGDKVAAKLLDFRDRHKKEADAMEAWFDQATRSGSDPRYDKTDARNKQIAVPSFRTRWKRKENDKLHAAFNKFSPEAKALINEAVDAYKTMHKETAEETISTILDAAVKASGGAAGTSIALPKSETVQSVTQWVTSGEIDKPKSQQSQRDKDIHKALNTDSATGVGGLIKNNPALRVLEGMYVPLMRRGKNVVSATKDYTLAKNLPAGATAVDENSFVFLDNMAAYEAYIDSTTDTITDIKGHKKRQRVYVQNRHVQFFDNATEAQRVAKELRDSKQFDEVKDSQWLNEDADRDQNLKLLPGQTQALIRSVRQLQGLQDHVKLAAEHAITQAALQQIAGNRLQHRHMARTGVKGNSTDMVLAMKDYANANAMYRANLRTSPQLNAGLKWANEWIAQHPGQQANQLREIVSDFSRRVNSTDTRRDQPWIRIAMNLSFVNYLMSFSYLALQTGQPFYSTLPELIAKAGNPATASAALAAAYGKIGVLGLGSNTFNDLRKTLYKKRADGSDHAQAIINAVKGKPEEDVINGLINRGVLDKNAGQEMDLRAAARTTGLEGTLESIGDYVARPLRAVTSGIEAMNRAVSGIAAYNVAIGTGMSHAASVEYAIQVVEDTQGNYSSANAPALWDSALGKAIFQFKKYPLMILNKLGRQIRTIARHGWKTKEGREAITGLASTFVIYALLSGATGALPWEVINLALLALKGIGVDWSKDKTHEWLAGWTGKQSAEVLMNGLPRLLGADVSNRISLGSLMTFGEPKGDKADDIWAYIGKTLGGPVLGMLIDAGWSGKGPPMPKVVKDIYKGYKGATEGAKSEAGLRKLDPYSTRDTIIKSLGFSTAKEARQYEPGGIHYETGKKREIGEDRSKLINIMANATTPGERDDAWDDIKDWNKSHKGKERIDRGDVVKRRQQHRKQERKERREGLIE